MLCGLHHRHVGHSTFGFDHSSWQVHRISRTKKMLTQAGVLFVGAACGGIFWCSEWHEIVIIIFFPLHCM